jgi:hypothetical protein
MRRISPVRRPLDPFAIAADADAANRQSDIVTDIVNVHPSDRAARTTSSLILI